MIHQSLIFDHPQPPKLGNGYFINKDNYFAPDYNNPLDILLELCN